MELFNIWFESRYTIVAERMVKLLEKKMEDIGDEPVHPVGMRVVDLRRKYRGGAGIAEKALQNNM